MNTNIETLIAELEQLLAAEIIAGLPFADPFALRTKEIFTALRQQADQQAQPARELTDKEINAIYDEATKGYGICYSLHEFFTKGVRAVIAADRAIRPAAGMVLPCNLRVGAGTFHKGVTVSTAQGAIDRLYERMRKFEGLLDRLQLAAITGMSNRQGKRRWVLTGGNEITADTFEDAVMTLPAPKGVTFDELIAASQKENNHG